MLMSPSRSQNLGYGLIIEYYGFSILSVLITQSQSKLEEQYAAKREAHVNEVHDLKQQVEIRANEIRNLNGTVDGLKSVNEELKVSGRSELNADFA